MRWSPANIAEICPEAQVPLTACSRAGYIYLSLLTQLFGGPLDMSSLNDFSSAAGPQQISGPGFLFPATVDVQKSPYQTFYSNPNQASFPPSIDFSQPNSITGPDFTRPTPGKFIPSAPSGPALSPGFPTGPSSFGDSFNSVRHSHGFGVQTPNESGDYYRNTLTTNSVSPTTDYQHEFSPVYDAKTIDTYKHGVAPKGVSKTSFYMKGIDNEPEVKFSFETEAFGGYKPVVNPFSKPDVHAFDFEKLGFNYQRRSDDGYDTESQPSSKIEDRASSGKGRRERRYKRRRVTTNSSGRTQRSKRQSNGEEFDFIVVGAGSAGCVVANRLSEVKKWKVLLLEAGGEEPAVASVPAFAPSLARSSIDWQYRTQPEPLSCRAQRGQTCPWFRGKVMGGSSVLNYMIYMRGNRRDYDHWAELGNDGWSYAEVLPYFKKSEDNQDIEASDKKYHSVGGPLNVERFPFIDKNVVMLVDGFKELGLPLTDFNAERQIGTMTTQTTSKDGRRWSVNVGFIRPIRYKRPNLVVKPNSEVTKILIDPHTKVAYGVQYFKDGAFHYAYSNKEVIVSGGAINSPKILMLSGVGPREQLQSLNIKVLSDLKVGYNLQDHVTTDALILTLSNKTSTMISPEQLTQEVYYYYNAKKKDGPLAATGTLFASAFIRTEYAPETGDVPDIQFHFDGRNVQEYLGDPTTVAATNIFPLAFYNGLAARPILLTPRSRGYIMLNETHPLFGPPLIYSRFFTKKVDLDSMVSALKYAVSLENTHVFKINGASYSRVPVPACRMYPWGSDDYFACLMMSYTSTIYHPAGTCKMGPRWDREAVVDPRLRVYGIQKLRVIDASIMPLVIRGNTNAPSIMIGEKGADMIKEEWLGHKG